MLKRREPGRSGELVLNTGLLLCSVSRLKQMVQQDLPTLRRCQALVDSMGGTVGAPEEQVGHDTPWERFVDYFDEDETCRCVVSDAIAQQSVCAAVSGCVKCSRCFTLP